MLYIFIVPITFNNQSKVCFPSKRYLITIQTSPKEIVISIFLIERPSFNGILEIISLQKSITNHFLFRFSVKQDIKSKKEVMKFCLYVYFEKKQCWLAVGNDIFSIIFNENSSNYFNIFLWRYTNYLGIMELISTYSD